MLTTTKLVWILATIISLNSVHVQCGREDDMLKALKIKEEISGDRSKFKIDSPCTASDPPDECQKGTIAVMKDSSGSTTFKITSHLGYALKCKDGKCACHDEKANATTVGDKSLCLQKDLGEKGECIHTKECKSGHMCLLSMVTPNPSGRRECVNLSIFLKPNYYIVAILLIFPLLLGLQELMQ